ncbi:MAG TPA: hypothetical protein VLA61_06555 [Ideonella sp.]|uniref:hypothetical protein n=1 Tax=Ideonella sp. TaxID=1929293 RepID=UPI002CC4A4BE|nr:hypothetical protein [Ideonella sp.]HSI47910.1 hypothetical protein [Ideonella sp.]
MSPGPRTLRWLRLLPCLALAGWLGNVSAADAPIRSAGTLLFTDADTLVVADWRGAALHALKLPPLNVAPAQAGRPFNQLQVATRVAKLLGTSAERLQFEDMAMRPGAGLAYLSLSVDRGRGLPEPAVVTLDASGLVRRLDLARLPHGSAPIAGRPTDDQRFWADVPAATYTVTDMVYQAGKLYVAGLSNAAFASTLRVYDFPFNGTASATSVEMYHAVHNQVETRAPIRRMAIATLNGEPTLVAAYTCTPLVTIPLRDLKDGAHIVGRTVAELGWGSAPVGLVSLETQEGPALLLANSHKAADLLPVSAIAAASMQPGLAKPINWPTEPYLGVKAIPIPLAGIVRLGVQDKTFLTVLRRHGSTGALELVSLRQGAFLRLSDFINEYDFADFRYQASDGFRGLHGVLRSDEGYPELARRTLP